MHSKGIELSFKSFNYKIQTIIEFYKHIYVQQDLNSIQKLI